MWTRSQLKMNAKQLFKRNYWACVGAAFLMTLFAGGSAGGFGGSFQSSYNTEMNDYGTQTHTYSVTKSLFPDFSRMDRAMLTAIVIVIVFAVIISALLSIFIGSVFEVGGCRFFILNRTGKPGAGTVLGGFKSGHYGNIVLTIFLRNLYINLWSLLLVIPGTIKSFEYLMVPYILAENPGMDRKEAFAISKRMMDGEKWDAFVLSLSFIGWDLLALITCGIAGIFYVTPYEKATFTELYAYNKIKAYNEGYIR